MLVSTKPGMAIDFASDVAASGQRLRVFSVVDAFTRECLALETDASMPSRYITRVLQRIIGRRGAPQFLRSDNGPEMSSRHYLAWCMERNIGTIHIQPGKPMQNGHIESFHGRLRDECLNASWFGISGMLATKLLAGETNTTSNGLTQHWATEHRKSSQTIGRTPHRLPSMAIPLRWNRIKAKPCGRPWRP